MNTVQELIDGGFHPDVAQRMYECYANRIGEEHGKNAITDITYDVETGEKRIIISCKDCGAKTELVKPKKWQKWEKIKRTCDKCKDREKNNKIEKISKKKKDDYDLMVSRIGGCIGDFRIIDLDNTDQSKPKYICKCCECGNEIRISAINHSFQSRKGLRCTAHYTRYIKYDESYLGRRYGYLTIKGFTVDNGGRKSFLCECDCGKECVVQVSNVALGRVKSCGCMHDKLLSTHGMSGSRLYFVWRDMIRRCYSKDDPNYRNYGGRGIKICDEWRYDFVAFHDWAFSNGYDENAERGECTIDRIDVNGNYEPDNCRWADKYVQARNKRPSSEWKKRDGQYEYNGKMYQLKELCEMFNTSEPAIRYRMLNMGMTLKQALETEKKTLGRPRKKVV